MQEREVNKIFDAVVKRTILWAIGFWLLRGVATIAFMVIIIVFGLLIQGR